MFDSRTLSLRNRAARLAIAVFLLSTILLNGAAHISTAAAQSVDRWRSEWPNTDFAIHSVEYREILSGGPPKDGIPSIDNPKFVPVAAVEDLAPTEPVVGLVVAGEARAYPLRILTWHEIVNDVIGGKPVTVTYCPLCNSAIVFDRTLDGQVLEFGTTGKLRNSDLVMYDRTTESWWQQFLGEAIVGEMTGKKLTMLPSRLESWERFAARHPEGSVLVPNNENMRSYGQNPYDGYDSSTVPFLYRGEMPEGIEPMARVVAVGKRAWSMSLLRENGKIESEDLVLTWEAGQNSALDTRVIAKGRDVGNVVVQRRENDVLRDVPYDVTFAFVFHAFHPDGDLRIE